MHPRIASRLRHNLRAKLDKLDTARDQAILSLQQLADDDGSMSTPATDRWVEQIQEIIDMLARIDTTAPQSLADDRELVDRLERFAELLSRMIDWHERQA